MTELDLPVPQREGYDFIAWYYDDSYSKMVDKKVIPTENITLYAKWEIKKFTITFIAEGNPTQYAYVDYGETLEKKDMPAVPSKQGYIGKWEIDKLENVQANSTVYAEYTIKNGSVVYYVSNHDTDSGYEYLNIEDALLNGYKIYSYDAGAPESAVSAPGVMPQKAGFHFLGWYYDKEFTEKCINLPNKIPYEKIALYARFMDVSNMSKYVTYINDGDGLRIVGLTAQGKTQETIVIPSSINGKTVLSIGYENEENKSASELRVFDSNYLTNIIVPETVKIIGSFAFVDCARLKTVTIEGNALRIIGTGAFAGCINLREMNLPDSVVTLGSYALSGITSADNGGDKVDFSHGESAWSHLNDWYHTNMSLEFFGINEESSLSNLKQFVFLNTPNLKNISIPNSLTEINYMMFDGSGLKSIEIYDGNSDLKNYGGGIYSKDGTILYLYPAYGGDSFVLNPTTARINANAFRNNKTLVSITLNANLSNIASYAFYNAQELQNLNISPSCQLSYLGSYAFANCAKLEKVAFPPLLNYMGEGAFQNCIKLTRTEFGGNSLGAIPKRAFYNCELLDNIIVPSNVKSIGEYAFYNCKGLNYMNLSENDSIMTSIEQYAFAECTSLNPITLPYNLQNIGKYAFSSEEGTMKTAVDLFNTKLENIGEYAFLNCNGMSTARFPSTILNIGEGVFKNCANLLSVSLTTATLIEEVPAYLFYNCYKISNNIIFPSNLNTIGDYAFYNCAALTEITLNDIKAIGQSAFENCVNLNEGSTLNQYILPQELNSLGQRAFANCASLSSIHIPKTLSKISKEAFSGCANLVSIIYSSGYILDTLEENCFSNCVSLVSFEIPSTLKKRATNEGFVKNPFSGCTSLNNFVSILGNLYDLVVINGIIFEKTFFSEIQYYSIYAFPTGRGGTYEVASNVEKINEYAFYNSSITELNFAQSTPGPTEEKITIVSIGDYAFCKSNELTKVNLTKRLCYVGKYAFNSCRNLEQIIIDSTYVADGEETATSGIYYLVTNDKTNNLLVLDEYSFGDTAILSLDIPARLTNINNGAFRNCSKMISLRFADSADTNLLSIGDYAFYAASGLTAIELPIQLQTIGDYAFAYCVNVREITFKTSEIANGGEGVTLNIGKYSFSNCHFLYTLNLPSSLGLLEEGVFSYNSRLKYINFSQSLTSGSLIIPEKAFIGDASIEQITIPCYVQNIGNYAFFDLSIDKITFLSGELDLEIGDYSFADMKKLNSIMLPDRLTKIGNHTFENSNISEFKYNIGGRPLNIGEYALSNIKIKDFTSNARIVSMGSSCLANNKFLENVIYSGDIAVIIDSYTFSNSAIKSLVIAGSPNQIIIGDGAFENTINLLSISKEMSDYILEAAEITIGTYAFYKSAIASMCIKADNLLIDDYAFNSTKLKSFIIKETGNILRIGKMALAQNPSLSTLIINAITSIGDICDGFASYNNLLKNIDLTDPLSVYSIDDGILYKGNILLSYPAGKAGSTYQVKIGTEIIADYAFAGNILLGNLILDSGEIVITKQAKSFDKTSPNLMFFTPADLVSSYINTWAVANINHISSELNGMVLKLLINDRYVLEKYTGLDSIVNISNISDGETLYKIVAISDRAFFNNISLQQIKLGDNIENIGKYAFANCGNLTSVILGKMTLEIDSYAFSGCSKLTLITFNEGLSVIGAGAFKNCASLEDISLPDSLKTIDRYAFADCVKLSDVNLGKGVESLGENSFAGCKKLISFSIPQSVKEIKSSVFSSCNMLSYIYIDGNTTPTLDQNGFADTLKSLRIFVPGFLLPKFLSATNWRYYSDKILSKQNICVDEGYENYVIEHIENQNYRLLSYIGTENDVNIEFDINGKHITEIGRYAFNQFPQKIILAEGILSINDYAFANASNLKEIEISGTMKNIGNYAFYNIFSLEKTKIRDFVNDKIIIPELTTIGNYAFYGTSLKSMAIPAKVSSIGNYAFSAPKEAFLENIVFEMSAQGFLGIGNYAFMNNKKIVSITFNGFVDKIGAGAFNNCVSLRSIYFNSEGVNPADNSSTKAPSETIFLNCNNLSVFVKKTTVQTSFKRDWKNNSDKEKILLVDSIFKDVNNSIVYIYENGDRIEVNTKNYFVIEEKSSSRAYIKNYIGDYTGRYIDGYNPSPGDLTDTDIIIPSKIIIGDKSYTVEGISSYAFNSMITSVTIPNTVISISNYAFYNATNLREIIFSGQSELKEISNYAFANCASLTSFTIPKSVITIGDYAFANCKNLAQVNFQELLPADIKTTLTLRNGVFQYCTALESVKIPNHAISLGSSIFKNCTLLSEVIFDEIQSQVKTIGQYAFASTDLQNIVFPNSLEGLGDYSFDSCKNLLSVYITRISAGGGLTNTDIHVFNNIANPFIRVYVPFTSYDSYSVLPGWRTRSVLADQKDDTGKFNYILNNEYAIITNYLGTDTTFTIPSLLMINNQPFRVTSINSYAGNNRITKINYADTPYLTTLASNAFANCVSLREIHLPDTITSIGENAFYNCTALTDVLLPSGIDSISNRAFYNCSSLREIILPSRVSQIGEASFGMCSNLNRIVVETTTVRSLGAGAFTGVSKHFRIIVPSELKGHFANEWHEYGHLIYARSEMYGDFIVIENNSGGITVIQYNGYMDNIDLSKIKIKNKSITEVAENAFVDESLRYII